MTTLSESYKLFGGYDQYNLRDSVGIEKIARRTLRVIDAYSDGTGAPSWKMAAA